MSNKNILISGNYRLESEGFVVSDKKKYPAAYKGDVLLGYFLKPDDFVQYNQKSRLDIESMGFITQCSKLLVSETPPNYTAKEKKDLVIGAAQDLVSAFLYYDRKNDEELRVGDIEKWIKEGIVTEKEIVATFTQELKEKLEEST